MGVAAAAWAAFAVAAVGTAYSINEQEAARRDRNKSRQEQQAANAARAARERRQQVREERIRRAQVLQSAENSGVTGGSGEFGATSNLSTQLYTNLGLNASSMQSAERISQLEQSAAGHLGNANAGLALSSLTSSIFSAYQPTPSVSPEQVRGRVNQPPTNNYVMQNRQN